jgi:polyphosphate kinase
MAKNNKDKINEKGSEKVAAGGEEPTVAPKSAATMAAIGAPAPRSAALPKDFSIDNPTLPKSIDDAAMRSGGYPYEKRMKREEFEEQLLRLQIELVKLQIHNIKSRGRILILYEGRDGAGKGSCIKAFGEHLNPRNTRTVALTKPTETERGQLYFQRYAAHLPTAGEIVLFDRSWYNRAGVERVMGFCNADQVATFLREAPEFEGLLVRDGIRFFKFYLSIGREMQIKRFHERRHDPLKQWKISEIDLAALDKFDAYSDAQADMFRFTHTTIAPWLVVRANDQRRARLETIRAVLLAVDYEGRDLKAIGKPDLLIVGSGPAFFGS